jgi:hypothetical protein
LYVSKDRRLIWLNNRASRLVLDDNYTTPHVLKFDRKGLGVVCRLDASLFYVRCNVDGLYLTA